jgi:UMF1 family MFS transporter
MPPFSTGRLLAWSLYDLANTFFAVAMLSFYFPLWVVETQRAPELRFSTALAVSMIAVALLMPFCGALSDATGLRMRYLRWTTYGCAAATLLVGLTDRLDLGLLLFGAANICYQLGTVFYDALLWNVAAPGRLGAASGTGAAFGYLGSAIGLVTLAPFVAFGGYQAAFAPAALGLILFAIPSFVLVRDPEVATRPSGHVLQASRNALTRLAWTLRSLRSLSALWRLFWASFFSLNAINTILVFMVVYMKRVAGYDQAAIVRFFVFSQLFAVAGSLVVTRLIPRWGAKRTLGWIWAGWLAALALAAVSPSGPWLWVVGPLIGFCLGPTWATSRVLLVELSAKDRLAEMLGLAGLFARASSVVGPMLWGLLVLDPARYRYALLLPMSMLAAGIWLLRRVPSPEPAG